MTFEPAAHRLAFVLPLSFQKGDVTFYPTTQGPDVRVAIEPDARPRHVISTAQLTKGVWVARLQWSDGQQQYYQEQELIVS
ncbi:FixH family protein [Fibrella sp. HMF5335]|uniref:FixH family protein n=1 Tax=Fibrella rubiginis TaxID=2817060 RepID=A0A939GBP5_9BACT|nr:FixH family protein [Fibrella rubiginis]MBO0935416.1 FixH family protein [Fibrella rubiginis]